MQPLTRKQITNRGRLVTALRTGKVGSMTVKQGRYRLHSKGNYYCCLGVACLVVGVDPTRTENIDLRAYPDVRHAFGFELDDTPDGRPPKPATHGIQFTTKDSLATLNDRHVNRYNFADIADVIELDTEMRKSS